MDFFASAHSKLILQIFAFAACFLFATISIQAQEVTLVTSGEGMTKSEATAAALRSAIEQSFETFVSANTTILNDDIVKDEVATVTSGNIKSYKELSCTKDQQGVYTVSVSATVSLGKLIEYAKSHGSSAEFAGQTFAMNMKMLALNKKNEEEALQNLLKQLETFVNSIFDYNVKIYNPTKNSFKENQYDVIVQVNIVTNKNYLEFFEILQNTLRSLSIKDSELSQMHKSGMFETGLGLNLGLNNEYYKLRNNENNIYSFTNKVCDILNNAQLSFGVCEKGKSQGFVPKEESIIRFCPIKGRDHGMTVLEIAVQERPGMIHSNENGRVQLNEGITISQPRFKFEYTLDGLSSLNGFEARKYPRSQQESQKR